MIFDHCCHQIDAHALAYSAVRPPG